LETDQSFHDIFLLQPNWLGPLIGQPIAPVRQAKPAVFKAAKVECDLLFEPEDPANPDLVVEFQLYYDASIFNRTELARCLRWKEINAAEDCRKRGYVPREVGAVIIFGDASHLPELSTRPPIPCYFLDQCWETLKRSHPSSPLNALLAPIVSTDSDELAETAASQYGSLRDHPDLSLPDRETFKRIYFHLLSQRFKTRTQAEIEVMIADLVPLDQTRVGLDLIEKGRKEGRQEGLVEGQKETRREIARSLLDEGYSVEQISQIFHLSVTEVTQLLQDSQ